MRVNRRVYNTSAFQSYDIEVPAVGTGSTSYSIMPGMSWFFGACNSLISQKRDFELFDQNLIYNH